MSSALERAFQALELLSTRPSGCPLSTLASELDIPLSASHRLLAELIKCGYVRQNPQDGQYVLTIKLVSVGLSFLSASGIVDVAQPLLDNLASVSGDLVRLAVVDGEDLTFVAKAQGATRGLRYDPDMGLSVALSCSAAGIAWLSTMSDDEAMTLVAKKGLGKPEDFGPKAPTSIKGVMTLVKASRQQGFSMIVDVFGPGMSSMAAPVLDFQGRAIGVVTIAGPSVRLNAARMEALGPALLEAAQEVSRASTASSLFKKCA